MTGDRSTSPSPIAYLHPETAIGERIREERTAAGLTLWALAETLGTDPTNLSRIERGHRRIDSLLLYRISQALGVAVESFFVVTPSARRPESQPVTQTPSRPRSEAEAGTVAHDPRIDAAIRAEAAAMAPHYEIFYALEQTIRRLVHERLREAGPDWWRERVPERARRDAERRRRNEIDSGVTPRSDDPIDFLTFGELGETIKANWDVFGRVLTSAKAVERVMANLNTLRGAIAHCSPLAEDEVVRLRLTVRDWFRLVRQSPPADAPALSRAGSAGTAARTP